MNRIIILALCLGIVSALPAQKKQGIHHRSVLVDTHNDVLSSSILDGLDISKEQTGVQTDIPKMQRGGLDIQFFSVWTGETARQKDFFDDALQEIDSLYRLVTRNPGSLVLAKNFRDVKNGLRERKIVSLIGVEGGHMIMEDLDRLDSLASLGMRYLTLTWNNSISWASSAMDETLYPDSLTQVGLSKFGESVVRRMNELGVIVDLSHVGESTFYDALRVTRKPVLLSHSSVWSLCPVFRNVKDEQIRAVAKNKGVICINFYSGFISRKWDEKQKVLDRERAAFMAEHAHLDSVQRRNAWRDYRAAQLDALRPTIGELVDHIDHIVKLVGDRYVGIGSDYDGVGSLPVGLEDVSTYPKITEELVRRGYSRKSVKRILGGNVLRVMKKNFD